MWHGRALRGCHANAPCAVHAEVADSRGGVRRYPFLVAAVAGRAICAEFRALLAAMTCAGGV
jgi:hypothetical protein